MKSWKAAAETESALQPVWFYRQEPAKSPTTLESDVWIPVLQALIISTAWALITGLLFSKPSS